MRTSINLMMALTILFGLSSAEIARAQAPGGGASSGSSQAAPANSQKKRPQLGKRLAKLKNRMEKKKAAPASGSTPAPAAKK